MLGTFKLLLAGGVFAVSVPFLAPANGVDAEQPQLPGITQDAPARKVPVATEKRWNFAELQYTTADGKVANVPARRLAKLWLLSRPDGGMYLQIVYENSDYSLISVRDFHIIRRSATYSSVDVPIVRTTLDNMAFPVFQ